MQKKVNENIKKIIEEKGLKQKYVAKKMGMSESSFSACINEKKIIRPEHIQKICNILEVTPNELINTKQKGA